MAHVKYGDQDRLLDPGTEEAKAAGCTCSKRTKLQESAPKLAAAMSYFCNVHGQHVRQEDADES